MADDCPEANEGLKHLENQPCLGRISSRSGSYANPLLNALSVCFTILLGTMVLASIPVFTVVSCVILWKGKINLALCIFVLVIFGLFAIMPCLILVCFSANSRSDPKHRAIRIPIFVKYGFLCCLFVSFGLTATLVNAIWHLNKHTERTTDFDPHSSVLVVGAGASGLAAAWTLAAGGRKVTLLEAGQDIGGHSRSWNEKDTDGSTFAVDLGFIFNSKVGYGKYKAFAQQYNSTLVDSDLNTSSYRDGQYWDNHGNRDYHIDQGFEKDIDKFLEFTHKPATIWRLLAPLGVWAWWEGFSDNFWKHCLDSNLSVLFVTKMGLAKQSAQTVINHFTGGGFTHLRYDGKSRVQRTVNGSQNMWRRVLKDMVNIGMVDVRLGFQVKNVKKENGLWTVTRTDGVALSGFQDVVLAVAANVARDIADVPTLHKMVLNQVDYIDATVTLHTDSAATLDQGFAPADSRILYFVGKNHMSGRIASIFGHPSRSDLILTVHGQEHEELKIRRDLTKWETTWQHHYFTLWELIFTRKFLPYINGEGNLHYAGDWVVGMGHEDAIASGTRAACRVGVPPKPASEKFQHLYSYLVGQC